MYTSRVSGGESISPLPLYELPQPLASSDALEMDRRTFNAGAVLGVVGMAFARELRLQADEIWQSGHTELWLPKDSRHALQVGIAYDGFSDFGPKSGRAIAHDLQRITPEVPWGGVTYSNEYGVSLSDNARLLAKAHEQQGFSCMDLYGRSMGGMFGLNAAMQAQVPLGMIFLNCSPFSLSDARNNEWAQIGAMGVVPAIPTTTITEDLIDDMHHQGVWGFTEDVAGDYGRAEAELPQSGSPMLQETQLASAEAIDLWRDRALFTGIIRKDITRAAYVMTANPNADDVVNNRQAYAKYKKWFASFGIELYPIYIAGQHAGTSLANHNGTPWIRSTTGEVYQKLQPQMTARQAGPPVSRRMLLGRRFNDQ
jgi:pimeloyl-ACP methyl ester carboxylesterase